MNTKIFACGDFIGEVTTNHSMTTGDMLALLGNVRLNDSNETGDFGTWAVYENDEYSFSFDENDISVVTIENVRWDNDLEGVVAEKVTVNGETYRVTTQEPTGGPDCWVWVDDEENPTLTDLWSENAFAILDAIWAEGETKHKNDLWEDVNSDYSIQEQAFFLMDSWTSDDLEEYLEDAASNIQEACERYGVTHDQMVNCLRKVFDKMAELEAAKEE